MTPIKLLTNDTLNFEAKECTIDADAISFVNYFINDKNNYCRTDWIHAVYMCRIIYDTHFEYTEIFSEYERIQKRKK